MTAQDADQTDHLIDQVHRATANRTPLNIIGGGTKSGYGRVPMGAPLKMADHRGVLAYEPTEMVITARAGTPLSQVEALLAAHHQGLAFEPPRFGPSSTLGGVVAAGLCGPARPFAGAVRDSVLGVRVMNGKGQVLRFGGTVFKNVAGFDAFRLMAGGMGMLGPLLDISLRVAPLAQVQRTLCLEADWSAAQAQLTGLMRRPLPMTGAFHQNGRLYIRLAGGPAAVESAAHKIGGDTMDQSIWSDVRDMTRPLLAAPRLWRLSVPQAAMIEGLAGQWTMDWAGSQRWLVTDAVPATVLAAARTAGGHATLFRGAAPDEEVFAPLADSLLALHQRIKAVFDPAGIFNPGRMYKEL